MSSRAFRKLHDSTTDRLEDISKTAYSDSSGNESDNGENFAVDAIAKNPFDLVRQPLNSVIKMLFLLYIF